LPLPLLLASLAGPLQTGPSPSLRQPETLLLPLAGVVTQGVHADHPAIDIACSTGAPVVAAHAGSGSTQWSSTHGWTFVLRADDGLETRYSHLAQGAPAGRYSAGDLIGLCGNTGRWSTGPHLHFSSNRPSRLAQLAPALPLAVVQRALASAAWLLQPAAALP
jgi:murein DD-endopeptidase MepM/ murein hydrolase activator NlpD